MKMFPEIAMWTILDEIMSEEFRLMMLETEPEVAANFVNQGYDWHIPTKTGEAVVW